MKLPINIAQKLKLLIDEETIPFSTLKHSIIDEMLTDGIIITSGRIQKKIHLINKLALNQFLQSKYGINDLNKYIEISLKENVQRSELVQISSNSKHKNVRTFKGFLINSYNPIQANLNGKEINLEFNKGCFHFIYDFQYFIPSKDITIVGIENPENFRWIEKQKHLFSNIKPIFISRYPQNQNKDIINWLLSIPNNYIHFGDFDLAGIGIYMNEYKKYLEEKASFFVPINIEKLINQYGNKNLYNNQKINFDEYSISENNLLNLIKIIHKHKKGLEQEIFIQQVKSLNI